MKQLFSVFLTFIVLQVTAQSFKVRLNAPQYKSGIAYLTYHMGKNLNVEDSAAVSAKGLAIFQGKRKLPGGIYSVVLPGKSKLVDFFIDKEQVISVQIDTSDLLNKTVVTGSKENIPFVQYQKYMAVKGRNGKRNVLLTASLPANRILPCMKPIITG